MVRNKPNLVLVGFMGAGKTAVGREVAARLGRAFVDLDQVIADRAGLGIPEIFARYGEAHFRVLEAEIAREVALGTGQVIATGGGTIANPETLTALRRTGVIIWLAPPLDLLLRRILTSHSARPLASLGPVGLRKLYAERERFYRLADYRVTPAEDELIADTADKIVAVLDPDRPTFEVTTPTACYPFRLSRDFTFPELTGFQPGRAILVTDSTVGALYADQVSELLGGAGWQVTPVVLPAGEKTKTLANAEVIWRTGFDVGLDRHGLIVALGGGVIGDLAGFAAATYMRGTGFLIIPTTLLAMVDSSIGGKVAINHERGKNLIGAFYHPRAVLAPLNTLASLDERNLAAGWAEVVKSALIGDAAYFHQLSANLPSLTEASTLAEAVFRSALVKRDLVNQDQFESGVRKHLNLGHTLAHALEQATGYDHLLHGEAVAIGLVFAAMAAEKLGLADEPLTGRVARLLAYYQLPTKWPDGVTTEEVLAPVSLDKKNQGGRITLILPAAPGRVFETNVTLGEFTRLVEQFRGELA